MVEITLDYQSPTEFSMAPPKFEFPRVGLALSGGGARSLVQLGVIKALAEAEIEISAITGTSMGAVIGGLYCSGFSTDEINVFFRRLEFLDPFRDHSPRESILFTKKKNQPNYLVQLRFDSFRPYIPSGLTPGQSIHNMLMDVVTQTPYGMSTNFDEFPIPFRAVATDLVSGNSVLFASGNLVDAMHSSMAFPLLFMPVKEDSMLLVDGGLINNIPVNETRALGMDIVLAVDNSSNLRGADDILLPWEIVDQASSIMQRVQNEIQRKSADVCLRFDLPNRVSGDFFNIDTLVHVGYERMKSRMPELRRQLMRKTRDMFFKKYPTVKKSYQFRQLSFVGNHDLSDNELRMLVDFDSLIGQPVSAFDLYWLLAKLQKSGYFQRVSARIGDGVLEVSVFENLRIESVSIYGNNSLPDSVLSAHFKGLTGRQLNYRFFKKALRSTLLSYRDVGYALARIDTCEYNADGEVKVFLDEGVVGDILISGNEITKLHVIRRDFPVRTDDIFNYQNVKKGIQNIYGTDLFSTVRMDFLPGLEALDLVVQVSEKKYQLVRLGGRYDNERKGRGFIQVSNENIYGTGNTVSAIFEGGEKDSRMAIQFRSDRIFKSFWTSQLDGYYKQKKYFSYNNASELVGEYAVSRSGFDYSVGRQMGRLGTIFLEGQYSYLDQEQLWGIGVSPQYFVLGTITLRSIVDTRDQLPFARKGRLFQFYYQASSEALLGSEVSFYKLYSSLEDFFTIFDKHVVRTKLVWGTSDVATPLA
ncbi:patatin-like phospholipase family protein, partial [bacterium]|nr:patatin-like phospholipase family protein [bacterium]